MKKATGYCLHCSGPMNVKDVGVKVCAVRDPDSGGGYCERKAYPRKMVKQLKKELTKELKKEQKEGHQRWHYLALLLGFNELAKDARHLGERVYFRIGRDMAEEDFKRCGGAIDITRVPPVLVLPDHMPRIEFGERDLDMMRAEIARVDGTKTSDESVQEVLLKERVVAAAMEWNRHPPEDIGFETRHVDDLVQAAGALEALWKKQADK